MGTSQNLTGAQWRKSSYSGTNGGDCVECTVTGGAAWRKSSYSGTNGGECVEVVDGLPCAVPVRDSKNPDGPVLIVGASAWRAFVGTL
ncbi:MULTISPECIES: DUF397 domain-containing protein [unclassified Streptomyces]|uniref:DUF397 domain-containing protein n=1 Tax=unclassified Streptomyces TaxID=2593676 RepID=UPI002E77F7D8|nr:DUF397 domain-containing protein [Streptomyces sp. JV184]MEE1749511.1 DUF397 domain-containing protein [Streptomyces sp. JV184]